MIFIENILHSYFYNTSVIPSHCLTTDNLLLRLELRKDFTNKKRQTYLYSKLRIHGGINMFHLLGVNLMFYFWFTNPGNGCYMVVIFTQWRREIIINIYKVQR